MASGKGFGKIILFGEHFVVYGLPGIASGINKYVKAEIKKINKDDIVFCDKIFGEKLSQKKHPKHIVSKLFNVMFGYLNISGIEITISSNFPPKSGMGYSAALNTAISRAINNFFKLNRDDKEINEIAFKGENLIHGKASGIDNTCSTRGSLIRFEKQREKNKIVHINCKNKLHILQINSGIKHDTKQAVDLVKKNKEKNLNLFKILFNEEKIILKKARQAIETGDIKKIGLLMNKNQYLLRQIGISCKTIEKLIKVALDNGALGAKITGAGMGGSIIALCKDSKQENKLNNIYKKLGYHTIKLTIK